MKEADNGVDEISKALRVSPRALGDRIERDGLAPSLVGAKGGGEGTKPNLLSLSPCADQLSSNSSPPCFSSPMSDIEPVVVLTLLTVSVLLSSSMEARSLSNPFET